MTHWEVSPAASVYVAKPNPTCPTTHRGWRVPGSPMGGMTGVSLEQGLGLVDISRGHPGRRPGGERGSPRLRTPPDCYMLLIKLIRDPPRDSTRLSSFLDPLDFGAFGEWSSEVDTLIGQLTEIASEVPGRLGCYRGESPTPLLLSSSIKKIND